MASLIERYIYEVVRRLPEKDRAEVSRELYSNIQDMLGSTCGAATACGGTCGAAGGAPGAGDTYGMAGGAGEDDVPEEEVWAVLSSLGSPAALAESYRQKPRYLISPALFDDYIRALRWLVPMIGGILLAVGCALAGFDVLREGAENAASIIGGILSRGISMGVSGAFHALVWVTVGFAIAERAGARARADEAWTVDMLPEEIPQDKGQISLADTIVEMAMIVIFAVAAVLLCLNLLPFAFVIRQGDMQVRQLFASGFLAACIPAIIIGAATGIAEGAVKLVKRRWTPLVCGVVVAGNAVGIGLMLFLATRREVFSAEFLQFLSAQKWSGFLDVLRFMGQPVGPGSAFIVLVAIIVIVASLAESGVAIYRTVKATR